MLKNKNNILYLILLFAMFLRLYGINFEVPHPDDYITVQGAMHFGPARVTPTGYGLYGLYVMPAFTLVIIQTLLFSLYFITGWITGVFPSAEAFKNFYLTDPSSFYLIGRLVCVSFGVGTIWIIYYLAKMLCNYKVGLLAALFLSVSFIHSFHSQFIRPDIPTTFFVIAGIICCLMIIDNGKDKYYIYGGIFAGLATATKLTSGVLIVPLFVAHIMFEGKWLLKDNRLKAKNHLAIIFISLGLFMFIGSVTASLMNYFDLDVMRFSDYDEINKNFITLIKFLIHGSGAFGVFSAITGILLIYNTSARNVILNILASKKLLFAGTAALITFMLSDPIFFLDFKRQLVVLLTDANFMGKNNLFVGVDSLGFWGNLWWYLTGSLSWGAGPHIELMAGIGLILLLYRKRRKGFLVFVFPLLYLTSICFGKFKWERYSITLMPFVALCSAFFFYAFVERVSKNRLSSKSVNIILTLLALTFVIPQTYNILRYDYLLTQKDTRTEAREWVEKNISPGNKIGQDAYTGVLSNEMFQITKKFTLSSVPLSYYLENGYQYLMVSDTQYNRYLAEPKKYPGNAKFYNRLFMEGALVKEFSPQNDLWPAPYERFRKYHIHISPKIRLYRINNHPN